VQKTPLADHRAARFAIAAAIGAAGVLCFAPFELFWLAPLIWLGLFKLLRGADTTRQAALD
jgi:apolipoprotein N-acyltransferase